MIVVINNNSTHSLVRQLLQSEGKQLEKITPFSNAERCGTAANVSYSIDGVAEKVTIGWNKEGGKYKFEISFPDGFNMQLSSTSGTDPKATFTITALPQHEKSITAIVEDILTVETEVASTKRQWEALKKLEEMYNSQKDWNKETGIENKVGGDLVSKEKILDALAKNKQVLEAYIAKYSEEKGYEMLIELKKLRERIATLKKTVKGMELLKDKYLNGSQKNNEQAQLVQEQVTLNLKQLRVLQSVHQYILKYVPNAPPEAVQDEPTTFPLNQRMAIMLYDTQPTSKNELQLNKGDVVKVIDSTSDDIWWEGEFNGKWGYFPASYAKMLQNQNHAKVSAERVLHRVPSVEEGVEVICENEYPQAAVIVKHIPTSETELALSVGDIITVYNWEDEYWWEGSLDEGTTGYFPHNCIEWIDKHAQNDNTKPEMSQRDKIVKEILLTERTYLKNISLILSRYEIELKSLNIPVTLTKMFVHIHDILPINRNLLLKLEKAWKRWSESQTIGSIFLTMAPFLKVYSNYSADFPESSDAFKQCMKNSAFSKVANDCSKMCNGHDLESLLIQPVQRIPRYELLLSKLITTTSESHPDFSDLQNALSYIRTVADGMNKSIADGEKTRKVFDIQTMLGISLVAPDRKFVKEGTLGRICRNSTKKKYKFFLFSDLLIYASSDVLGRYNVQQFPLEKCLFENVPKTHATFGFLINSQQESFVVESESQQEQESWLSDLVETYNIHMAKLRKMNKISEYDTIDHAPVMMNDKAIKACLLCSNEFSLMCKSHNCRACGALVCGRCSDYKMIISETSNKSERVCHACFNARRGSFLPKQAQAFKFPPSPNQVRNASPTTPTTPPTPSPSPAPPTHIPTNTNPSSYHQYQTYQHEFSYNQEDLPPPPPLPVFDFPPPPPPLSDNHLPTPSPPEQVKRFTGRWGKVM